MSSEHDNDSSHAQARHLHAFLKTRILWGAMAAGTAVTVAALVRRHRVSTNAAKEALMRLEDEGLVSRAASGSSATVIDADAPPPASKNDQ